MKGEGATILLVDDISENIDVLVGILREEYHLKAAINGPMALKIAQTETPPDLILLDIMMPGMDGFEVCRRLKEDPRTAPVPVIFITAKNETVDEARGFAEGAVDYITKPVSPPIVMARVKTHLDLFDQQRALERTVFERTEELHDTRLEVIRTLGRAAEYKDNETGLHVVRMSQYARLISIQAGVSEEEAEVILNAAPMHDVGKIGIPDRILQKPDKLDPDEWRVMMTHAAMGSSIIGDHESRILQTARIAALTHHEKWNGAGYPRGLSGRRSPWWDVSWRWRMSSTP